MLKFALVCAALAGCASTPREKPRGEEPPEAAVERWLRDLHSGDPELERIAAENLARLGAGTARPPAGNWKRSGR